MIRLSRDYGVELKRSVPGFVHTLSFKLIICAIILSCFTYSGSAQLISKTLFSDDFAAATIDPAKYQADAPFFEGGTGDILVVEGATLTVEGETKGPKTARFDRPERNPWQDVKGFRGPHEIEARCERR